MNHCQDIIYPLSLSLHCPNGVRNFSLLISHKFLISFFQVHRYVTVVWFFLGQLNPCIRFKFATVSVADFWRWVHLQLIISLIKKIPLDMRHQFTARDYEVVKSPSKARCDMRQVLCVLCVDTSVSTLEMLIWLVDMNFHTSRIQDSICSYCWFFV